MRLIVSRSITNKYTNTSFNFGPTLLSRIEKHHPETYRRILIGELALRVGLAPNVVVSAARRPIAAQSSSEEALVSWKSSSRQPSLILRGLAH